MRNWGYRARRVGIAVGALWLAAAPGCASLRKQGPFVWVDDYDDAASALPAEYVIAAGDLVSVQVWDHDKLSTRARVRSDGRISMPLLNDVQIAGKAPTAVASEVARQLKEQNFVVSPRVNVLVEEATPATVSVLGSVSRPGTYPVRQDGGVAEVIATAGGLTDFAHRDRIYVIRRTPQPMRIRFRYKSLTTHTGKAASFRLRAGDVIVAD